MKTKTYRSGTTTCRSYSKTVGNGVEVGFTVGGRTVFCGNFVHSSEAATWYTKMNREISTFSRRYKVGPSCPKSWYTHFLGQHLYNQYYAFLDKTFTKHTKTYKKAVTRSQRKYQRMNQTWYPAEKKVVLRAA